MMRCLTLTVVLLSILTATPCFAALWYVDNAASGTNAGTSWTNAWQSIAAINYASVSAGDTIYISGGSTTKTYDEGFATIPKSGTAGNVITISTGQDAGHNGTAIMTCAGGTVRWMADGNLSYVHVTGNVGNANHLKVNCIGWIWHPSGSRTFSHIHLSYIDFDEMLYGLYFTNGTTQDAIEIDHNLFNKKAPVSRGSADVFADDVIYGLGGLSASVPYDTHLVHHNTFNVPVGGPIGDDMMKWGSGYSFYNNTVNAVYDATYPDNQHSDLFQLDQGHYKIYNNVFTDVGESIVYFDAETGVYAYTGLLIYNNIFQNSRPPSDVSRAMDLVVKAPAAGSTFTDFIVANNTFVDWTDGIFAVRFTGGVSYPNARIQNNLFINSSGLTSQFSVDQTVTQSNNSSLSSAVQVVAYTQYATDTNDLHLAASDTAAKNLGVDLSAMISAFDKDGIARDTFWDLGSYEFVYTPPEDPPLRRTIPRFHHTTLDDSLYLVHQ